MYVIFFSDFHLEKRPTFTAFDEIVLLRLGLCKDEKSGERNRVHLAEGEISQQVIVNSFKANLTLEVSSIKTEEPTVIL